MQQPAGVSPKSEILPTLRAIPYLLDARGYVCDALSLDAVVSNFQSLDAVTVPDAGQILRLSDLGGVIVGGQDVGAASSDT